MRARAYFLLAILPVAHIAQAANSDLTTTWRIQPTEPRTGEQTARPGDVLWEQPLLPAAIVALNANALATSGGKPVFPAGTQLMEMDAGSAAVFCDFNPRKAGFAEQMLIGKVGETATCLIDADKDGHFDGFFTKKVQYEGFPIIRGGYPDAGRPLVPGAYAKIAGAATSASYYVGLRYIGRGLFGDRLNFQVVFGGPKSKSALSDLLSIAGTSMPMTVEVVGAHITVLAADGGTLRYRIDSTMSAQDFSVRRTYVIR